MSFKDVHVSISRICECVFLHGKRDFANVIKLRILSWGDYSGLFWWAQYNHQVAYKEKKEA